VFAQGKSPLMDCLAQMSVLYEDLRIETFALTANDEDVKRLDHLDKRYRVHYFLRRSIATLLEFRGALLKMSRTEEFKAERASCFHRDASLTRKSQRELFGMVSDALTFFHNHHDVLKNLRNAVGGHFGDAAAHQATANVDPDAVGKLEVTFDKSRQGGGSKLHYAGEIAATAFTKHLPAIKPRQEEIGDTIRMIRDGYAHLTKAMHALVVLFLWDRFR
jgi:hypothetical protein